MSTRNVSRAAFTLVELLVVIGIIALLISILLPTLGRANEHARRVKCMAGMKQIGLAAVMYCNDNRGFMPYRFRTVGGVSGTTRTFGTDVGSVNAGVQMLVTAPYGNAAQPYLKTPEVFFCPSDFNRRPYRLTKVVNGIKYTMWGTTGFNGTAVVGSNSMSYFAYYIPDPNFSPSGVWTPLTAEEKNIQNDRFAIKRASERAWLADQGFIKSTGDTDASILQFPFFHPKGWNVLYLDGHAKWVGEDDLKPFLKTYNPNSPWTVFSEGSIRAYNAAY
jgi:prepilin-type N-terminal cleavage/methylation domain-containing protein/prepilin-type processing-associated H-X9-DG protein